MGYTALHGASQGGFVDVVRALVEQGGADVHARTKEGYTALHSASHYGHVETVRWLVERGKAEVDVRADNRKTPLMAASSEGHAAVVQALLEAGADPCNTNLDGATSLDLARKAQREGVVRFLWQTMDGEVKEGKKKWLC